MLLLRVSIQAQISNLVRIGHSMCPRSRYIGLVYMGGTRSCRPIYTDRSMANISLLTKLKVRSSLRSDAIVFTRNGRTDGRTGRHSSNILEFCADQMSPRNIGSQIIISRCYKRIDKTNSPSMRRV